MKHVTCISPASLLPWVTCAALLCSSLQTASRAGALGGSLVLSACLNHSFQALPIHSLGTVCNTGCWPNTVYGGHICSNTLPDSTAWLCHTGKVFLKWWWINLQLKYPFGKQDIHGASLKHTFSQTVSLHPHANKHEWYLGIIIKSY